jgi:hypothetical protein
MGLIRDNKEKSPLFGRMLSYYKGLSGKLEENKPSPNASLDKYSNIAILEEKVEIAHHHHENYIRG